MRGLDVFGIIDIDLIGGNMLVTLILSAILMAALLLMIYAAVAFIQSKKLFTSAPQDIQQATQNQIYPQKNRKCCFYSSNLIVYRKTKH